MCDGMTWLHGSFALVVVLCEARCIFGLLLVLVVFGVPAVCDFFCDGW